MQDDAIATHTIIIEPNNSLTVRGAWIFFSLVTLTCLTVGLTFASMGFWPVLPFVGLEIFAFGLCLGLSMRRGRYREIISISEGKIITQSGHSSEAQKTEFQRHWSQAELLAPKVPHHPHRLIIRCGAQCCEVASCLTETERKGLWKRLTALIGRVDQSPPLQASGDASPSS